MKSELPNRPNRLTNPTANPTLNPSAKPYVKPSSNPLNRLGSTLRRAPIPSSFRSVRPPSMPTSTTLQPASELIDYHDRISVATWLMVFAMGLRLLFTLIKTPKIEFSAFGSPITIAITDYVVAGLLLGTLAAACTESIISLHPALDRRLSQRMGQTWSFWALPTALTVISVVLLPYAPSNVLQVLGLLVYAVLIATTFFSLYATVEVGQIGYRRGRATLNALTYSSALLLFVIVYQTRTRSLLSGTMVAVTATLLTIELIRSYASSSSVVISYGLAVGFVLGQVTWALNYWPIDELTGGLILALIFYLMVGIAQQGLQGRLRRRVVIEYAGFALAALLLIAVVGRGFRDIRNVPVENDTPVIDPFNRF